MVAFASRLLQRAEGTLNHVGIWLDILQKAAHGDGAGARAMLYSELPLALRKATSRSARSDLGSGCR